MSGVTVRGDRLLVGRMTAAVARAEAVMLVRRGEGPLPTWPAVGRGKIAVNRGGHLERVARAKLPEAELVVVDDNRSLPRLLANREVDAVVTDSLEAATFPGDFALVQVLSRDRKAYWTAPGRDALADDLDAWLLARERDGTLNRLRVAHLPGARGSELPAESERVVDLAARRLMLMPLVAAAKRAAGLPIVDPAREATVIATAAARAREAGLDPGAAERLARAQIGAARAIQEQDRGAAGTTAPSLAAIRSGIDALDAALLRALVTARAAALPATGRRVLALTLQHDADLPGFDQDHAEAVAAGIADVLRPAP
jgi:cyclohexadienyl dehydratase